MQACMHALGSTTAAGVAFLLVIDLVVFPGFLNTSSWRAATYVRGCTAPSIDVLRTARWRLTDRSPRSTSCCCAAARIRMQGTHHVGQPRTCRLCSLPHAHPHAPHRPDTSSCPPYTQPRQTTSGALHNESPKIRPRSLTPMDRNMTTFEPWRAAITTSPMASGHGDATHW